MNKKYLKDLEEIRTIMERSGKILSLSGISGISVGLIACLGATYVWFYTQELELNNYVDLYKHSYTNFRSDAFIHIALVAIIVLTMSILAALYFSRRRQNSLKRKDSEIILKRFLEDFSIPLVTGGILSLIFVYYQLYFIIPSITLIFYGIALIFVSRYTVKETKQLGILEIVLGLIAIIYINNNLIIWAIGFGFLHIVYGILMYYKYEKS